MESPQYSLESHNHSRQTIHTFYQAVIFKRNEATMKECFFSYPAAYPVYASRIIGAIYAIYCLVIISFNIVLIFSFFATKQSMRNTSNLIIVCWSVSDILIGAIVMPMQLIESLWFDSAKLCSMFKVSKTLQFLFGGISFAMTMLLAIDRYVHMNPNFLENESKIAKLFRRPIIYILIFVCCTFITAISLSLHFLMEINPQIMAYFTVITAIILLIMIPIFVTIYTRSYLRIRRFVAENLVYQNRGEADSNESPEYLKELFKTVLLLVVLAVISCFPFIAFTLTSTILSFVNQSYINTTRFVIISHIANICVCSNSFLNALIILYRNKKSRKWLKEYFHSFCKQRKVEDEPRSQEVIVNAGIKDAHEP